MGTYQQLYPLLQDCHCLRAGYRGKIVKKVIEGMPSSEVIQQRFDRNARPNKDWCPTQDVWIAVHNDALIFHRVSSLVQCNTETHAPLTPELTTSRQDAPL
jgi:hypothetical protein